MTYTTDLPVWRFTGVKVNIMERGLG